VARVESKTVISTPNKLETVPEPADGVQGQLGYWMSPENLDKKLSELYPGCMRGIIDSIQCWMPNQQKLK
jgi:phosphoenolpyruvate carboxykinase (GTP)